jgi:hypothetical protein
LVAFMPAPRNSRTERQACFGSVSLGRRAAYCGALNRGPQSGRLCPGELVAKPTQRRVKRARKVPAT